jgi:hypothetical protein
VAVVGGLSDPVEEICPDSASVRSTSRAKACMCLTNASITVRSRALLVEDIARSTDGVTSSSFSIMPFAAEWGRGHPGPMFAIDCSDMQSIARNQDGEY